MRLGISPAQWLVSLGITIVLLGSGGQDPQVIYAHALPHLVVLPLQPISGLRKTSTDQAPIADLSATSVYVLTQENGEVLFEHNSNTAYAPASTTKLMTALVARQAFEPERQIMIPNVPFEDTRQPLQAGEMYQMSELLAALLISSNNTAAYAFAESYPGGYDAFVAKMNETAVLLQLANTHFTNPAGFDDPQHRSTARDLGQLFRVAFKDPLIAALLGETQRPLVAANGLTITQLYNTHQLLYSDQRALAGKTGTTDEAKQVLITLMQSGTHPYVLVVLGSEDRYTETTRLANWVDERYTWQTILPSSLLMEQRKLDE